MKNMKFEAELSKILKNDEVSKKAVYEIWRKDVPGYTDDEYEHFDADFVVIEGNAVYEVGERRSGFCEGESWGLEDARITFTYSGLEIPMNFIDERELNNLVEYQIHREERFA